VGKIERIFGNMALCFEYRINKNALLQPDFLAFCPLGNSKKNRLFIVIDEVCRITGWDCS